MPPVQQRLDVGNRASAADTANKILPVLMPIKFGELSNKNTMFQVILNKKTNTLNQEKTNTLGVLGKQLQKICFRGILIF